jgi:hypothetical protein
MGDSLGMSGRYENNYFVTKFGFKLNVRHLEINVIGLII